MITVKNSQLLAAYKKANNITTINVFLSKKNNKYACDDSGEYIGAVADDLDKSKPVYLLEMVDSETGEAWKFICNSEPPKAIDTL